MNLPERSRSGILVTTGFSMKNRACYLGLALALASVWSLGCGGRDADDRASGINSSGGGSGDPANSGGTSFIIPDGMSGAGGETDVCAGENPPEWCNEGMFISSGPSCGDGELNQASEVCDDGNTLPGDGCNGVCAIEPNFACPVPGEPCVSTIECGDGVLAGSEICDDGNAVGGDGCAADCQGIEPNYYCPTPGQPCVQVIDPCNTDNPPPSCEPVVIEALPTCGDGIIQADRGEQCDDGNTLPGDGCTGGCSVEPNFTCPTPGEPCVSTIACGNGLLEPGEVCDDGNTTDDDGCNSTCDVQSSNYVCITPGEPCERIVFCGDGRVSGDENCEDGNTVAGDGCDENCVREPGYVCRVPGEPCVPAPRCGDSVQDPGEACDDGNSAAGDGCSGDCTYIESGFVCPTPGEPCQSIVLCGDGLVHGDEQCDDGNIIAGDGCDDCVLELGYECPFPGAACIPLCGDGIVLLTERCDDGNTAPGDGCSPVCDWEDGWACTGSPPNYSCHQTTCGDGIAEGTESCDDGNTNLGDGCTPFCNLEPDCSGGACTSTCGDGLLLPSAGEVCDDGNNIPGDGCSSTCRIESGYECEQPPLGESMEVPVVYRDFDATHADFQFGLTGCEVASTGMVQSTLDAEGKPVLIAPNGTSCATTSSVANFSTWYRDTPGANTTVLGTLTLWNDGNGNYVNRWGPNGEQWEAVTGDPVWCADAGGSCDDCPCSPPECTCYDPCTPWGTGNTQICAVFASAITYFDGNPVFFPIDGQGQSPQSEYGTAVVPQPVYFGNWEAEPGGALHNFHFTSEVRFWFEYDPATSPVLDFTGDDDVWVFINNRLAVDLGGIHVPVNGSVDLVAAATALGLTAGNVYEIVVFQAEREKDGSSYKLTLSGFNAAASECGPICGDGNITPGEACDNGTELNTGGYGACNPDCTRGPYCGDGNVDADYEECDDGVNTSSYGTVTGGCAPGCTLPPRCGDGMVQGIFGERCDDGINDGSYGGCTADCQPGGWCGDGVVQTAAGEQCDDGLNDGSYNTCGEGCVLGPRCGDGVLEEAWGEECDDGNNEAGDGCGPTCRNEGVCGDAFVDAAAGEQCDDGDNDGGYGECAPGCVWGPHCGDGVPQNPPEDCDDGINDGGYGECAPNCLLGPRCGDGITQLDYEQCDDGEANGTAESECNVGCVLGPHCGDAIVQADRGEQCDAGEGNNIALYGPGCGSGCILPPFCGDSEVNTAFGERCDDGVNAGGYGMCAAGCQFGPRCGDGQVQTEYGEVCDEGEGGNDGGYGECGADCLLGPHCGDGILQPAYEECDDGNHEAGDMCDPSCKDEIWVPE